MQRGSYNTVTLPVLIPADLLPGERTQLMDDFRMNFPSYGKPPRKGESHNYKKEWIGTREKVIALKPSDLDSKTRIGKKLWKQLGPSLSLELNRLIMFRNAMVQDRIAEADNIYGILTLLAFGDEASLRWKDRTDLEPNKQRRLSTIVAGLITHKLETARIVLWWNGSQLTPAIWCEDLQSALYVLTLGSFAGGREATVCPHCQQFFVKSRPDQDYCSVSHREAHRVARWRSKKRQIKEKEVNRGAGKTR